ncbi:MAG: zf-HC2 domain-containing protein [Actinomycetota bacterium]|nr:zf-HC2 domain-containing protein [Actinomycetota bacterium]
MRCEEVRPLIPELAEGVTPDTQVERHLATCASCSPELERYRGLVAEMGALRDVVVEPPPGFLGRVLAEVPGASRASVLKRVRSDERFQYAALSLGGAVVGAAAIGLLWRRSARRLAAARAAEAA